MKYSLLFAALLAVVAVSAGCDTKQATPSAAVPPQGSDASKTLPPKAEAPASAPTPAVAAASSTDNKSTVGGVANSPGGEAKPAEGTAVPGGSPKAKTESK